MSKTGVCGWVHEFPRLLDSKAALSESCAKQIADIQLTAVPEMFAPMLAVPVTKEDLLGTAPVPKTPARS